MFTGIVQGRARFAEIERREGLHVLTLVMPPGFTRGLQTGASVSVDGVCLTVTATGGDTARFDVMLETLRRTTLGSFVVGDEVNVERSVKEGDEIGGHLISGHIDCTAVIRSIETPENNRVLTFALAPEWMRYVFPKGFIAINGASLTVASVDRPAGTFTVWLIPETLRLTTFGTKKEGHPVNIEIERSTQVTVDTIRNFLEERFAALGPKLEALLLEGEPKK